jgi:hypothetical protein
MKRRTRNTGSDEESPMTPVDNALTASAAIAQALRPPGSAALEAPSAPSR